MAEYTGGGLGGKIARKIKKQQGVTLGEVQTGQYTPQEYKKIKQIPGNIGYKTPIEHQIARAKTAPPGWEDMMRDKPKPIEKPKQSVLEAGLQIAGEGLGSWATDRASEEKQETERKYQAKLKEMGTTHHEFLRKRISDGTATDKEVKEYRKRQKELEGENEDEFSF